MRVSIILFCAVLPGCLPVQTYYREGVALSVLARDELACEVRALRDAPVATRILREPPRYVPPRRICDAGGDCEVRGGFWVPGEVYTVDANAPLRDKIEALCMADQGYRREEIPVCPARIADAAPPPETDRLPRLAPQSCAIRGPDGTFRIVNRG